MTVQSREKIRRQTGHLDPGRKNTAWLGEIGKLLVTVTLPHGGDVQGFTIIAAPTRHGGALCGHCKVLQDAALEACLHHEAAVT